MGTKRVGWARIQSLINENTNDFDFIGGTARIRGAGDSAAVTGSTGTTQTFGISMKSQADGFYTYQEEVSLYGRSNANDQGCICELSKTLPANAKVLSAAITCTELSTLAAQTVGLGLSATAATAQGTAITSATELIGAAVGSAALVCSSGGTLGDTEMVSTEHGIDVGAKTSAYLIADGGSNTVSDNNTAGAVLVTINYFGSAAPA